MQDNTPARDLSMPLLTRTEACWPTCLYALRIGTLSRLISTSRTIVWSPGVLCSLRRKTAGFQSGASLAQNLASYHFSRPWNCIRSWKQPKRIEVCCLACGMAASSKSGVTVPPPPQWRQHGLQHALLYLESSITFSYEPQLRGLLSRLVQQLFNASTPDCRAWDCIKVLNEWKLLQKRQRFSRVPGRHAMPQ